MKFSVASFLSSRSHSAYTYTYTWKNLFSSTSSASRFSSSGRSEPNFSDQGRALYKRMSEIAGSSIVPVLDKWIEEGRNVRIEDLRYIIRQLNLFKRFSHGLEVSRWMTDKRFMAPSPEDVSLRLRFIYKVHGLEAAEKYFDNISQQRKTRLAHKSLLTCYCHNKSIEKAESLMQKIRDLGYNNTSVYYCLLMGLYHQLGDYEKVDLLVQEMEQNNIVLDKFVYTIQLSAYAAASDSDGVDKIVRKMESDPLVFMDTNVYSVVASAYRKLGLNEKALEALGKLEKVLLTTKSTVEKKTPYAFLIDLYGQMGKKDDVFRIWNLHKKEHRIYNQTHICMLKALVKLNETEEAEKILKEWESNTTFYDFSVLNVLITFYCKSGETKKAEDVLSNGIAKGGKPKCSTWLILACAYLKDDQFDKMIEALENANSVCPDNWKDGKDMIVGCLEIFGRNGDIKRAETEDLIELLKVEGFYLPKVGDKVRDYVNAQ